MSETNRAYKEIAPGQWANCGVLNSAKLTPTQPGVPQFAIDQGGTWHSGRSIRVNPMGDQIPDSGSQFVQHRNSMWFDIEIDKQYLIDNNISQLDTILRGNIPDRFVYDSIWYPIDVGSPVSYNNPRAKYSQSEPQNPTYGDIWLETGNNGIVLRIWSFTFLTSYQGQPGEPNYVPTYDWDLIAGDQTSEGLNYTTSITGIPTYKNDPLRQCRFLVQVDWNMVITNTDIPREMALYVYDGSFAPEDPSDYIIKSQNVRMHNKVNPGQGAWDEPTQKGFVPAPIKPSYLSPTASNSQIPITDTEIVMSILPGTSEIDPPDVYENSVFVDLVGSNPVFNLTYGAGSEAWVMAPVSSGQYQGNFPYYIGDSESPTAQGGTLTLSGAGRYQIYGPGEALPNTPEIVSWLSDQGFPDVRYIPTGQIQTGKFEGTRDLNNITTWQGIIQTTGERMFRDVTGDFTLPEHQIVTNLSKAFELTPDFTGSNNALNTWYTGDVSDMSECFHDSPSFEGDISAWDTSNVTTMYGMFEGCSVFDTDIGLWQTQNVTNMQRMFKDCQIFDRFLGRWDVEHIPVQPTDFDQGTTPDWTQFEKPWWGRPDRPSSNKYVIFDTKDVGFSFQGTGPGTALELYSASDLSYVNTYMSGQSAETLGVKRWAIFGYTPAFRIWNAVTKAYATQGINNSDPWDLRVEYSEFDYIHTGFVSTISAPCTQLTSTSYPTLSNVESDIENHVRLRGNQSGMLLKATQNMFGTEHDFTLWHDIIGSMDSKAFQYAGRLPDGLPSDLKFGYSGQPDSANYLEASFMATTNLPVSNSWQFAHTLLPEINLTNCFSYNYMSYNNSLALGKILQSHAQSSCNEILKASDLTNYDQIIDISQHRITSLKNAYTSANLTDTLGVQNHLTDCDLSLCTDYREMFAFSYSNTTSFVSDISLTIGPQAVLDYMFAKTQLVPDSCSSEYGYWDMSNSASINGMFFDSVFPTQMNSWDLSHYDSVINDNQGQYNMPCQYHGYVFTGCSGNIISMTNWKLPQPKGIKSDFAFDPLSTDPKWGDPQVKDSRLSDFLLYQDVLIPWWFAGCANFNTDISSWQTTPVTYSEPIMTVRLGTFAYAPEFNSEINWYYPDVDYYDLDFIRSETLNTIGGISGVNKLKIRWKPQANPQNVRCDSIEYGKGAQKHMWWHTFLGATSYNNGSQTIPTICANDMVMTFAQSGINANVTIKKPVWGRAYYQSVFTDTTAWTGTPVLDFECQNRSDTPDLVSIYYHSIYATAWFKDSNFSGTLDTGFKWFFYNVTNIAGINYQSRGTDRARSNWTTLADRYTVGRPTTDLGLDRALLGNVTDTDADIEADTGANIGQGTQGVPCITNSGLYDNPYPPQPYRILIQFCIGRPYTYVNKVDARHPVEITNLSEMFMNATNFSQDLSGYLTRWTPPQGAFTKTQYQNWDDDAYFGDTLPSTVRSYNNRNMSRGSLSNNVLPVYGMGYIPGVDLTGCDYPPAENNFPYFIDIFTDWDSANCDVEPTQTETYRLVPGVKLCALPSGSSTGPNQCVDPNTGEPCDYDSLITPGNSYTFTATQGPVPTMVIGAKQSPYLGYAVYRSDTTDRILVYQSYNQLPRGANNLQSYVLFGNWMVLENYSQNYTSWTEGTTFTADVQNKIQGVDYPEILVKEDQPITSNTEAVQQFTPALFQNGHRYNQYGDYSYKDPDQWGTQYSPQTPTRSDCDHFYYDIYCKYDNLDYVDYSPGRTPQRYTNDIPDPAWHAIQIKPKNFATGATNFTDTKWPLFMVAYTDSGQSHQDIIDYLGSQRPLASAKYITAWAWITEPYAWPTGTIYTSGNY